MKDQTRELIKQSAEIAMKHKTMPTAKIATVTARAMRLAETAHPAPNESLAGLFDGGHYYTFGKDETGLYAWQVYLDGDDGYYVVHSENVSCDAPATVASVCWYAARAMEEE